MVVAISVVDGVAGVGLGAVADSAKYEKYQNSIMGRLIVRN